jgi:hypothetical protein
MVKVRRAVAESAAGGALPKRRRAARPPGGFAAGFVQPASERAHAQAALGAFPGPLGPWPAKRIARSSAMVAAPGMFILLAVLTDW